MMIAIAGYPNAGKSTLFNVLTGLQQATGNWPGVTVEKRVGRFSLQDGSRVDLVDLPGACTLPAYTPEERVTQHFLETATPALVISLVDANRLERDLAMTRQIQALGHRTLVVLNKVDLAGRKGRMPDVALLEAEIQCPVVPMVASRRTGLTDLHQALGQMLAPAAMSVADARSAPVPGDRLSLRAEAVRIARAALPYSGLPPVSRTLDHALLNPWIGIPLFLMVMYLLFFFTIHVGGTFIDFFDIAARALLVDGLGHALASAGLPDWVVVVMAQGLGGGIQLVLTFIPVIATLYLGLSFLEGSGYLPRAALVVDRVMRAAGLPGKAFVPLIVGFGCNVPAVMATRILEHERERKLAMLLSPFMSCSARLPVYALFVAAFFPDGGAGVIFSLYLAGILLALVSGWLIRKTLLPGESSTFMTEVPAWHWPTLGNILIRTRHRVMHFVNNAGKVIVLMVLVINTLSVVSREGDFGNTDIDETLISDLARGITPVFAPMGVSADNWPATLGILTGALAKEVVAGTLGSVYGRQVQDETPLPSLTEALGTAVSTTGENLLSLPSKLFDPLDLAGANAQAADAGEVSFGAMAMAFDGTVGAFAYLLFILTYFPCVATLGAIRREAGPRWAGFVAVWSTGMGWCVATLFYQWGTFASHPLATLSWTLGIAALLAGVILLMRRHARRYQDEAMMIPLREV
jgi:ferrous iron transport protein B